MKKSVTCAVLCLVAPALLASCAPSAANLRQYLIKNELEKAVLAVREDPAGQAELAALILEQATLNRVQSIDIIDILSTKGATGRRALKRIEEQAVEPIRSLSQIALIGRKSPKKEQLRRLIDHEYSDVRAKAVCAWFQQLDMEELRSVFLDTDHRVRKCAVKGIAGIKGSDPGAVAALLSDALRLDPHQAVRAAAAETGKLLGDDAFEKLKKALLDQNMGVRLAAIKGLFELRDEMSIEALRNISLGPMDEMAAAAAAELSRLGKEPGAQRLLEALGDKSSGIRATALLLLERAKIANRDELFLEALKDDALEVEMIAASYLSKQTAFVEQAKETLKRIKSLGVKESKEARDMLAELGDSNALKEVKQALAEAQPNEIVEIILRTKRAEELKPVFVSFMADHRESIRLAAAIAVLESSLH